MSNLHVLLPNWYFLFITLYPLTLTFSQSPLPIVGIVFFFSAPTIIYLDILAYCIHTAVHNPYFTCSQCAQIHTLILFMLRRGNQAKNEITTAICLNDLVSGAVGIWSSQLSMAQEHLQWRGCREEDCHAYLPSREGLSAQKNQHSKSQIFTKSTFKILVYHKINIQNRSFYTNTDF